MKLVSLAIAVVWCGNAAAAPATRYAVSSATITDLGTLGGASSTALDINDHSEIVGWAETPQGRRHAFLFRRGLMEDIGPPVAAFSSEASGINNRTRVVGTYRDPGDSPNPRGFRWDRGVLRALYDTLPYDCGSVHGSEAFAISDSDYIAGRVFCSAGYEAARWSSPDVYTLVDHYNLGTWRAPPFIWNNVAYDVNWSGAAAGRTKDVEQMVRWRIGAAPTRDIVRPLPTGTHDPGWPDDGARAINDAGAIVGKIQRFSDAAWRAFFWAGPGSPVVDLGVLPGGLHSYADDINEHRFIAGSGDVPLGSGWFVLRRRVAYLYHHHFGMHALPTLPGTLVGTCEAHALNERVAQSGRVQLVGYCEVSGGARRAVRWDVIVSIVPIGAPGPTP